MSVRSLLLPFLTSAVFGLAQQSESAPEAEIRRTVEGYMDAVRRSDGALASSVSTPTGRRVSTGGTAEFELGERLPSWKHRSNMIRRIEVLNPTTSLVIGVWRDFDARQPFDTGTFHYTMIREAIGGW